ncbi:MAG TPA: aspartate carbamoyltransferase catalytic subunit [Terriglobales bacterium]|jgi:aspartate carbamoyltransferase catalytic subunit|nr:aspartate carbamoyltransferase catalytic subunit [Terriglobales bacterium]
MTASAPTRRTSISRSLLDIEHLPTERIMALLKLAQRMRPAKPNSLLRGKTVALLFYETSTRTRVSFELAAKKLGATTTVITAAESSIQKGESLVDTVRTLRAAGADAIVIRHPSSGAPNLAARNLDIPVINAGDGMHEHPSQALLDVFTILQHRKKLGGLQVALIGDILHSRVARSNIHLLSRMGAQVTLCGPAELAPEICATLAPGVTVIRHIEPAIRGADVIMMLRVQKERLAGLQLNAEDYVARYQLNGERLRMAKRDTLVMHPGPAILGMELTSDVADGPQSVILEQVANGIPMRMAILAQALTGK